MATSINSLSKNGTRPSIPMLLNFCSHANSHTCAIYLIYVFFVEFSCVWRFVEIQISSKSSSAHRQYHFDPIDLITLAINHMGVEALMVIIRF
jgi:hypothetical protein